MFLSPCSFRFLPDYSVQIIQSVLKGGEGYNYYNRLWCFCGFLCRKLLMLLIFAQGLDVNRAVMSISRQYFAMQCFFWVSGICEVCKAFYLYYLNQLWNGPMPNLTLIRQLRVCVVRWIQKWHHLRRWGAVFIERGSDPPLEETISYSSSIE